MTTSYVTVAVTASVVSWWPRLPVHRQSRHQAGTRYNYLPCQWPVSVQQARCPTHSHTPPEPVSAGYGQLYADTHMHAVSPHPPLVCEEMLHLFMRIRVNMVFLIRYIGAIKAPHIDKGERV